MSTMSEILALMVHIIYTKNNFVHLHSKTLDKFKNFTNPVGYLKVKHKNNICYGSCYSNPYNSNGENAFNVNATYAKTLGLEEMNVVIVSNGNHVKPVKTIQVTPVSSDDWDILETSAETLQSTFLNQIRVVYVHQILTIWVSKSFAVQIHVDGLDSDCNYGSLEQYTEVVVSPDVKPCNTCFELPEKSNNLENNLNKWNFSLFKNVFSYINRVKPEDNSTESISPEMCQDDEIQKVDCTSIRFNFLESVIQHIKASLLLEMGLLRNRNVEFSLENTNHIIIEGDAGTGKTTFVNILSYDLLNSKYKIFTKTVECKTWKGKLVPKLKTLLKSALKECVHRQPSVLFLDDLDILFSASKQNDNQHSENSVSSYTTRLASVIRDLISSCSSHYVSVLATVASTSALDASLFQARGHAVFSISIRIPSLNQDMRKDVLLQFLSKKHITFSETLTSDYLENIILQMEGYCIQDIMDLVDLIYFEVLKRQVKVSSKLDSIVLCKDDVDNAISQIVPMSLKDINFHKSSSVRWKDVGGLELAKQSLLEVLIWPSKYPKIFDRCPLKMQSGILLYGAPGSGKTLLASAIAGESGLNFISIKGPELLSKFVGESEEGVRNVFRKAQNAKPCILFFDEFDSLAPRRGNDITGVTDRVVNQLLTELDGVESVSGVWVLAATSRPDIIDPALLRPGRLGTLVYCPLPNEEDRLSILKVVTAPLELSDDINLNMVATETEGYTGADLQAVLYNAYMKSNAINFSYDQSGERNTKKETTCQKINMGCVLEAIKETKASLKPEERSVYEKIYKKFSQKEEKVLMELEEQRITYA